MTFEHVGHDIFGREVYRAPPASMDEVLEHFLRFCAEQPKGLIWNGVHAVAYPGMTSVEFRVAIEMRADAFRARTWPKQVMAFAPEFDPFKIIPLPMERPIMQKLVSNSPALLVLYPAGTQAELTPKNGKRFSLEELQAAIGGGYIECVPLPTGEVAIVDEEGLLKGQRPNALASTLVGRQLVGIVAIGNRAARRQVLG